MARLTMQNRKMVVEATSEAEEKELSVLAYDGATVTVEKAEAKSRRKKAED